MSESELPEDDDIRPEYDFRGGVRGKHAEAYRQGYVVKVHRPNGEVLTIPGSHLDELDRRRGRRRPDPRARAAESAVSRGPGSRPGR